MEKRLFSWPYDGKEPNEIVRSYFDCMYADGNFIELLESASLDKCAPSTTGAYCFFPDLDSPDPTDHFDGVEIAIGDPPQEGDTILISEETFFRWLRMACEKYVTLHPEDKEKVAELLAKAPA